MRQRYRTYCNPRVIVIALPVNQSCVVGERPGFLELDRTNTHVSQSYPPHKCIFNLHQRRMRGVRGFSQLA
jgi:hypothetical protein